MMRKKISKRLSACLDALSSLSRIADIGTDHAYLPCYGITNGIIDSAIAIDVIDGPLMQAQRTVDDYGLRDKIELRKGSGLEPLRIGEVEGVVIAGMGGKLISQLLEESRDVAESLKLLVLQPQSGERILRWTLWNLGFEIIAEKLLEEDGIIYTIITARPISREYSSSAVGAYWALELTFGPLLLKNTKDELFIKKWTQEITKINRILKNIPEENERRAEFVQKKQIIKDVLADATSKRCN